MTELNKINFMSKSRFDNLSTINDDELYAVKTDLAEKDWVISYFSEILNTIYPVGSIYIGEQNDCPIASLIEGSVWQKISEGRVLEGSNSTHVAGTTAEAGLPNISTNGNEVYSSRTGNIIATPENSPFFSSGNLYYSGQGSGNNNQGGPGFGFDASLANSIYGNSDTVQPSAYFVNIWKRIS